MVHVHFVYHQYMSHMHAPIIGLKGFWYYAFFLSTWSIQALYLVLNHIMFKFKDSTGNQILGFFLALTSNTYLF